MLYMATGKPAHLGCKFLLVVSVVKSPMVVELLVITVFFCVMLPAGSTTQNKTVITNNSIAENKNAIVSSCWTYFTTIVQ